MAIDAKQDIQSQMIPLIGNDLSRDFSGNNEVKDQFFQNGVFWAIDNPQTGKKTFSFVSRPGLTFIRQIGLSVSIYSWTLPDFGINNYTWSAALGLYKNSTNIAAFSISPQNPIGWAETQPSNPNQYLVINLGSGIVVVDPADNVTYLSPTVITTVAVGSPSIVTTATAHNLVTGVRVRLRGVTGSTPNVNNTSYVVTVLSPTTFSIPVNVTVQGTGGTMGGPPISTGSIQYMNGYFYVITTAGQIYNCDFNDPLNWDPTRFITAQMYSGTWSTLARQNNFLIAFSNSSTQGFIDNANATGSPLENYESAAQQNGCTDTSSVAANGSQLTWVGYTGTGERTVYKMDGLSSPEDIGSIQVRNWLSSPFRMAGFYFRVGSKQLYLLVNLSAGNDDFGWIYDYEVGLWSRWSFEIFGGLTPLSVAITKAGIQGTVTSSIYLLFRNDFTYQLTPSAITDNGAAFDMIAQTQQLDFGTLTRKYMTRLRFVSDQTSTPCFINISYSDDYATTFTTARTVDISTANPFLPLGGNFRRRIYRISYTGDQRQRWFGLEFYFRFGNG